MRKLVGGLLVAAMAPMAAASPAVAAPAAPSAVTESGAHVVSHKDVDGDGHGDVVSLDRLGPHRCAVRVATASGASARRVMTSDSDPCLWHGAARIDGRPGVELSVVTLTGASSAWHSLLTWRTGRLVLEEVPENPTLGGRWGVDDAVLSTAGWKRTVVHGEARMIHREATADPQHPHHRWTGTRAVLAFRYGRWVKIAQQHRSWTPRQARALAGWHVTGLPRWA